MVADTEVLELAAQLHTVVSRLAYHLRTPATRLGVTPTRMAALAALAKRPEGLRQGDLATQMGVSAASMTRLVDIMLEASWVVRERDQLDQRAYVLQLSERGRSTLDGVRSESVRELSEDLAELEQGARQALAAAVPVLRELADRRLSDTEPAGPAADPQHPAPAPGPGASPTTMEEAR